jgi:hypothetical protein
MSRWRGWRSTISATRRRCIRTSRTSRTCSASPGAICS